MCAGLPTRIQAGDCRSLQGRVGDLAPSEG